MKNLILGLGALVFVSLAGCGGVSTFSCDRMLSGTRICIDYDGVSGDISSSEDSCRAAGGTLGSKCSTGDAVGGCRLTAPAGESGTVTTWYFSGTTANVMSMCGGSTTYVAP